MRLFLSLPNVYFIKLLRFVRITLVSILGMFQVMGA